MAVDFDLRNACIGSERAAASSISPWPADAFAAIGAAHRGDDAAAEDLAGTARRSRLCRDPYPSRQILHSRSLQIARQGTLAEAIAEVAAAKRDFTEDDVYQPRPPDAGEVDAARHDAHAHACRGRPAHRACRDFTPSAAYKRDYAWAIDIEICVFPQEGLLNDPGAEELLIEACEAGRRLIGGCPYTDSDPHGQIARIFAIARQFDLDIDFHLDFDLDPSWMDLDEVCRQTALAGWGGRVAVGHVTKLSALEPEPVRRRGQTSGRSRRGGDGAARRPIFI